ncbi:MAG: hypothetical protein ABI361_11735 [Nitrososphaera sp.]|jgi:transposase
MSDIPANSPEIESVDPALMQGANLIKPMQKFSPYTKAERHKRRKEVFRLHFEYGYSASKISEIMKVSRGTINSDIRFLYAQTRKTEGTTTFDEDMRRYLVRLSIQQARLRSYLDKATDLETRLSIERLMAELDLRLVNAGLKILDSRLAFSEAVANAVNQIAEKEKIDRRYMLPDQQFSISKKAWSEIEHIIEKDRHGGEL